MAGMSSFSGDVRQALRLLRRDRTTSFVVIGTLALAIGAAATVFGVLFEVVLRPLPYPAAHQLARLYQMGLQDGALRTRGVAYPVMSAWRERARSTSAVEGYGIAQQTLTGGAPAASVRIGSASTGLFKMLGVRPSLGATWSSDAEVPGRDRVLVLSHGLWRGLFNGDPGVIGRSVTIQGQPHEVIGVMPGGFNFSADIDAWKPLALSPKDARDPSTYALRVFGRVREGTPLEQAGAELARIAADVSRDAGVKDPDRTDAQVVPLHELVVKDVRAQLWLLAGAGALLMLLACANVANVLLARATAREREMAVRAALGASPWQRLRQPLVETLVLAILGGAAGLILAHWGQALLATLVPREFETRDASIGPALLAIAGGASIATCLLAGFAPAIRALRSEGKGALGDLRSGHSSGTGRLRAALVIAQVALAVGPLIGAGLLLRTLSAMNEVNPGFDPRGVLLAELPLGQTDETTRRIKFDRILAAARAIPSVTSAGFALTVPLWGRTGFSPLIFPGQTEKEAEARGTVNVRAAGEGLLATLRIPLRGGRNLEASDDLRSAPVMLVNEALARRFFPAGDAIGKRVRVAWQNESYPSGEEPLREIVGVVGDARYESLTVEAAAAVYLPLGQLYVPRVLAIRSPLGAAELGAALRRELRTIDPNLPIVRLAAMSELVEASSGRTRALAGLLIALAALGLILAAVGLYGVLSYSVIARRRELGIRSALGATPARIVRLVLGDGLRWTALGIASGLVVAVAFSRGLASLLFGVQPFDAATFLAVPALLAVVAVLACWLPARTATRIAPHEALKADG